jgi:hypothetical protein
MPFLRIVRDTRGYEYRSLVQQTSGRRGKVRQQILYWSRTPPNIKVGRQALDEDVMRALEAQNPDVQFDWPTLRDTPPLPPSVEPWRERRRAERAAKQLRDADEETEAPAVDPEPRPREAPVERRRSFEDESPVQSLDGAAVQPAPVSATRLSVIPESPSSAVPRRRRHGRRGRRGPADGLASDSGPASVPTDGAPFSSVQPARARLPDGEE